jgi:alpha-mannosidase
MAMISPLAKSRDGKNDAKRKILHIIGHSHIDAAWLWPWREGADTVLTTFRSALDRMSETPGFCYSHSSSAHYRWTECADPGMYAEIRERIRQKRWEVLGAWPVEPDCNIPSTESFVRHSLYGKEYCQRVLGVDVKIGFNPDSFGHAAGLPIVLKRAGYGYYVFMRPQEHEMKLPLLFWWEGADGSRVLALRIWRAYDAPGEPAEAAEAIRSAAKEAFAPGFDHGTFFLGVGDHGGAVTREQIRQVLEMQKDPTLPELRWSTLRDFFQEIENSPAYEALPVVKGELQHHARGCYSADGEVKFLNRRAERWLGEAECISIMGNLTGGHTYPSREYADAWWKVLFCQFHDMLAGTALYSDYKDVRDSVGSACETAQARKVEALQTMARRVDLSGVRESALFLFNPFPWRRKALVQYYMARDNSTGQRPITHLSSKDGKTIPIQWRPSDSMTNFYPRLCALVELPPCGYEVFELSRGEPVSPESYFDFCTVSPIGFGISSLKANDGAQLLSAPVGLVAISDNNDTWAHGVSQFRQEMGRPRLVSSTLVEDGPVIRVTRQYARWFNSDIFLEIIQFAGSNIVELRFGIDWHEHEQMLELEIPTLMTDPKVFVKVPGTILERRPNGEEEPYQDWAAVQGRIGNSNYTLAVLNNSTYSYNCLNGLFRTVLIRSAPFARHDPCKVTRDDGNAWQDQGRQERTFWLLCGKGGYSELALDRRAEEVQTPAECVLDSAHHGSEPWEQSFLEIMPDRVLVLSIKRSEGEDATIIRLQERSGTATRASLESAALGLDHAVDFRPWELKTLLVKPVKGRKAEVREVSLLET